MPFFENMNMKSNSKVKKKLLIAAVAVLAIVVAVILVCAAYLHAGRSSLIGQRSRDAEMLYEGHSYMYDEDNINILCIGVDARGEADTVGQGDALILVTLNVRDKTIRCLNINRDTLAPVKVFGVAGKYITTQNLQAALAFSYGSDVADGAELTEYTVSELLDGLPIHAYVTLDFDGISKMNELVGGVTVKAMEDLDRADIRQGETVTLSGEQAVYYVTERNSASEDIGTNAARMDRQKQYMCAWCGLLKEKLKRNPLKIWDMYEQMSGYISTDISRTGMLYLAWKFAGAEFTDDGMYEFPGSYERENYYDEYIVDDAALKEQLVEMFYREVE